jgi:hypothetical protein
VPEGAQLAEVLPANEGGSPSEPPSTCPYRSWESSTDWPLMRVGEPADLTRRHEDGGALREGL